MRNFLARHLRKRIARFADDREFPFHIGRMPRRTGRNTDFHTHEFTELTVILSGKAIHKLGDLSYPVSAGDVFVVSGSTAHGFFNPVDLELMDVMFMPRLLAPFAGALRRLPGCKAIFPRRALSSRTAGSVFRLRLSHEDLAEMRDMLADMKREYNAKRPGFETVLLCDLVKLVAYLGRRCLSIPAGPTQPSNRLQYVAEYLDRSYTNDLSLPELASLAGMSVRSFTQKFRQETGTTPMRYVAELRLARAKHLLRHGSASITDAALAAGFRDSNYFSRQFRKSTGLSPREFRRSATRAWKTSPPSP